MGRKLTYEYVKEEIEKVKGHILLSKKYEGSEKKLKIQCPEGHLWETSWDNFKSGCRCLYCSGKAKKTYQQVKEFIESQGYFLLSKKYIKSGKKLRIKCSKGHIYEVTWGDFIQGHRCPYCAGQKLYYNEIKNYIESQGYILLSNIYINSNKNKLEIQCPLGHIYKVTWSDFKHNNARCPICAFKRISNKNRLSYQQVKEFIESVKNYILISTEYKGSKEKLIIKHIKCGNIYPVSWTDFKHCKARCPYCNRQYSRISQELFKAIHKYLPENIKVYYGEHNHEYRVNTHGLKHYRKLDFYIPELKKVIEFDGTYWHKNTKEKDQLREKEIKEIIPNIEFLRIDEKYYRNKPEEEIKKCLDFIRN